MRLLLTLAVLCLVQQGISTATGNTSLIPRGSAIDAKAVTFRGKLEDYLYLRSGNDRSDETVFAWTFAGELWVTHDQGGVWNRLISEETVLWVRPHPHFSDRLFALTASRNLYASKDRGRTFTLLTLPADPNIFGPILSFHQFKPDWLIFHGTIDCDYTDCEVDAYYSTNFGATWEDLTEGVHQCIFAQGLEIPTSEKHIVCQTVTDQGRMGLVYSTDFFQSSTTVFDNILGMAPNPPFLVAAVFEESESELTLYVSVDGKHFSNAVFPPSFKIDQKVGYTVINSKTESLFLHVTSSSHAGHEFGTVFKSNSNGTNYVLTLNDVNRDEHGFVDFEKMQSLEGVAIANVVSNPEAVRHGARKILKTKISHSDGALWDNVPPPAGACGSKRGKSCSLHLHGFTERLDARNVPSSPSAVGILIATGNVGDKLLSPQNAHTYMSKDAGISWTEISDKNLLWEFGDSGSIIVTLPQFEDTNSISYTLNYGTTWSEFQFSDDPVSPIGLASIPSDTSRKFILFARPHSGDDDATLAIQIDFSQTAERMCIDKDFELWTPEHPQTQDKCLFGHVAEYFRRIPDRNCYVGKMAKELMKPRRIVKNCPCTRRDYECDYNYIKAKDGVCEIVDKSLGDDRKVQCVNDAVAWHVNTGYRKIAIDTCEGGEVLDAPRLHPCPGKEEEFHRLYGHQNSGSSSFFAILFYIVLAIVISTGLALFIANRLQSSGSLRLGEDDDFNSGELRNRLLEILIDASKTVLLHVINIYHTLRGLVQPHATNSDLGYYSRIGDEERDRILDSVFEDEDLLADVDNTELEVDQINQSDAYTDTTDHME